MPLNPKGGKEISENLLAYAAVHSSLAALVEKAAAAEAATAATAVHREAADAAAVSTNQLIKLGTIVGVMTKTFDLAAGVIRGNTLVALREEARVRGELSVALRLETQSRLQGIPIIGRISQAVNESFQQAVGTEYMARAAGVVEGAIPGLRGAVTGTRVSAAAGGIRERWQGEEERSYQMKLLGIRAGPGAVLTGVERAEAAAITEWQEREKEYRTEREVSGYSPETDVQYQRMEQARKLMEQFRTPQMTMLRSELAGGIRTEQRQAREEYVRDFGRSLGVTNVPAWYSLATGARPGVAPGEDTQIAQLQTLGTIADLLRDALKGINPAVMAP